jgi:putative FmdB family regulatory protein
VPIYDYACASCDETFEELTRFDAPPPPCPTCSSEQTERQLSPFLTPQLTGGQRRFATDYNAKMASMGCGGGGSCTHAH